MENKDEIIVSGEVVDSSTLAVAQATKTVKNSAGQEIVVYGENGEILDCKFQRVDFENPATLISYCDDVKDEISRILDSTAQLALGSQEIHVDENMIANITAFDESLDDSEKKREKAENQPAIIKGIKGILATLGVKKYQEEEVEETTYKGRYERYCEGIGEVSAAVESQRQGALNDIALRNSIIEEITPYIEILEEMIKVGEIDKATFDETVEALKQLPKDQDLEYAIQFKTQLSGVFGDKLDKLKRALITLKGQIQSYRMQQTTDMQIVMEQQSYLTDVAPLLKAQGSIKVFNRQQETRIVEMARLNEASNQAIMNNARDIEQNAQAVVELSLNGGITVETLKFCDGAYKRGISIVQNGRQQKQQQIAQNASALKELSTSLDSYNQELLQIIDDSSVMSEILKDSTTSYRPSAPVKKLGTKNSKKGKK